MLAEETHHDRLEEGKSEYCRSLGAKHLAEPPWQLKLTGALVLWTGIAATWGAICSILDGEISLDFRILFLFGAFGVLRRSPRSIWWVKWIYRLAIVAIVAVVLVLVVRWLWLGHSILRQVGLTPEQIPPMGFQSVVSGISSLGLLVWPALSFSLYPVRAFLAQPEIPANLPATRSWMAICAIVISSAVISQTRHAKEGDFFAAQTFDANVTILVTDSVSGQPLEDVSAKRTRLPEQWGFDSGTYRGESWSINYSRSAEQGGRSQPVITVRGKIRSQLPLTIGCAGHESEDIVINKHTPQQYRVKLRPFGS